MGPARAPRQCRAERRGQHRQNGFDVSSCLQHTTASRSALAPKNRSLRPRKGRTNPPVAAFIRFGSAAQALNNNTFSQDGFPDLVASRTSGSPLCCEIQGSFAIRRLCIGSKPYCRRDLANSSKGVWSPFLISVYRDRDLYRIHGLCNGCESRHGPHIPKRRQCWH